MNLMRVSFSPGFCKALLISFSFALFFSLTTKGQEAVKEPVYKIKRLKQDMKIDGNWDKPQWKKVKAIAIKNFIKERPGFFPGVEAKMMYDQDNLYVIFRVHDRYVRSITKDIGGPVWKDSAVEFFFSPDTAAPKKFFNLEVNSGGTPLLGYRGNKPQVEDIKKIEIGHSLPQITDPEISTPVTWTLEYRIPLEVLEKYSPVVRPKPGVSWRANFYKIAENTSNIHYLTWAPIDKSKTSFHVPEYFGIIKFQ